MDARSPLDDVQTFNIIGAAMAVHQGLGQGFLEVVYRHALAFEFGARSIPFLQEAALGVTYRGKPIPVTYRADFVCYGDVLVEIKAVSAIGGGDLAQLINYLKASGIHRGLLINFGAPSLQYRRLLWGIK